MEATTFNVMETQIFLTPILLLSEWVKMQNRTGITE